jgi:hypothetical protein
MTSNARGTTVLAQALEKWRADPRVAELFVGPSDCALAIWLVELALGGGSTEVRLLYAWIIQSTGSKRGVTKVKFEDQPLGEPGKSFRLHRVVLTETPIAIERVATAMVAGSTLGEAIAATGHAVPKPYDALRLGVDEADVARCFDEAPVRFLPTGSAASVSPDWGRPLSSPSTSQPGFVAALVRCGKSALFAETSSASPLAGADNVAQKALEFLKDQTGLDFTAVDASRLGNVEWISLPAADSHERGDVRFDIERENTGRDVRATAVNVRVAPGRLPGGTPILVRCRVIAGHEPATDECIPSVVGEGLRFPLTHEITAVLITIWRLDNAGRGHLWFEDQVPLIRQISFAMGLMGLGGSLETEWSASLKTSRKSIRERADRVRAIQQVHYESPGNVGRWAAWESAQREGAELARRLFPNKSSAHFFARGWTDQGPGDLSFVEWLRSLTDDTSVASMILVDPFFDDHGVREFLARVKGTQIEYVVLTNTQLPSSDDPQPPPAEVSTAPSERVPQRALRIATECKNMRGIVSRLQFRIVDLRSKGQGNKQLFHDRYLLTFRRDRGLSAGFNLSNSIQGATRRAPLLVTPIPADVLEDVGGYVGDLLEADPRVVGEAYVTEIISSKQLQRQAPSTPRLRDLPGIGRLMAVITGDFALKDLRPEELERSLQEKGLTSGESFVLTQAPADGPDRLRAELERAAPDDFDALWSALGDLWARTHDAGFVIDPLRANSGLVDALERYLVATPESAVDTQEQESTLLHLFRRNFYEVLEEAGRLLEYGPHFHWIGRYGTKLAAEVFGELDAARAVRLAERTWLSIPDNERGNDAAARVRAALRVLLPLTDALTDGFPGGGEARRLTALANSSLPVFRAFAVHLAVPDAQTADVDTALQELAKLPIPERLEALAWWVGELRVIANRHDRREPDDVRERRMSLLDEIVKIWPPSIGPDALRRVTNRLGGPGGGWAQSTTADLFQRVVAKHASLTWDDVEAVWFAELSSRAAGMLGSKSGNRYHFYAASDKALTYAEASTLLRSTAERRQARLKEITATRENAQRFLGVPFARSRSYERWADSLEGLAWLKALVLLVLAEDEDGTLPEAERAAWAAELVALDAAFITVPESRPDGAALFVRELSIK